MKKLLLTKIEKELIEKIKSSNDEETGVWRIPNLLIPIAAIVIAIIANSIFGKNSRDVFFYLNILINGSIPLIAINQISSLGITIFEYDKTKEKELGIVNTIPLRRKLYFASMVIFVLSLLSYCYQVINSPFGEYSTILITFLLSILLIIASTYVAEKMFLLRDDIIAKSFSKEILDEMKENGHGRNWGNK